MQQIWLNAMDLFSDAYVRWMRGALNEYKDVPIDGAALDEFGYTRLLGGNTTTPWRGLFSGKAFQEHFEAVTGMKLPDTLFAMRYCPSGHPEVRIKAIDVYWDFLRTGPLRIEDEFYNYSRQTFGDKELAGIHNTFHNHLTNDEPWASGLNWWMIPRKYGMSDEDLSLPLPWDCSFLIQATSCMTSFIRGVSRGSPRKPLMTRGSTRGYIITVTTIPEHGESTSQPSRFLT